MPKPFPEPDGNQPTPGPDDLALVMDQLMVASVMILKKILKVIMKLAFLGAIHTSELDRSKSKAM